MPKYDSVINEDNEHFNFDWHSMWDYDFNDQFEYWLHKKKKARKTVGLIGVRAQESLTRYSSIVNKKHNVDDLKWITIKKKNIHTAYPIYDWETTDVWAANAKFGWQYNKLYDLMYQAGVKLNDMRVASPFNSSAILSLKLYKAIDPNTWNKLIGRVTGADFTAVYGDTKAMGWKNITKPESMTWKQYCEFLLKTLPENTRANFLRKFKVSERYWTETGGSLPVYLIDELNKKTLSSKILVSRLASENTKHLMK